MATKTLVNDPLFPTEWYLQNTGQVNGGVGVDLNVAPVWLDYTGKGIRIAVTDQGVQLNHPDLAANVDVASSYDGVTDTQGGGAGNPVSLDDNHGTAVAGIIGAVGNNGIGVAGVAYNATLVAYRIPLTADAAGDEIATADGPIASAFQRQLTGKIDISNNSWGPTFAFGSNWNQRSDPERVAITALGTSGRNGLGTIITFAAGNDRVGGMDANLDNRLNNRWTITVAALSNNGTATNYSSEGANILVSGFGGGNTPGQSKTLPGNAITTTDRTSIDGYNTTAGTAGDYTYSFDGTSAATPGVSGAIALMLQAAPGLGYRDVQNIIAYSARFNDNTNLSWKNNAARNSNGGALRFSREYGFGQMDTRAAVRLAEIWTSSYGAPATEANIVTADGTSAPGTPPPSTPITPTSPVTMGFDFTQTATIARIAVNLGLVAPNPSGLVVTLQSPGGTLIPLVVTPGNTLNRDGLTGQNPTATPIAWPGSFTLDTPAFTGESLTGRWTLSISDTSTNGAGASFTSATIKAYGDTVSPTPNLIYTDDFATLVARDATRATVGTAGSTNRLNLAAVSSNTTIDLSGARQSSIAGQTVTVAPGAKFDQIYGGDGNDTIIGDGSGQLLYGGRGTNILDGGTAQPGATTGASTALYLKGRVNYTITGRGTNLANTILVTDNTIDASVDQVTRVGKMQFLDGILYTPAATDQGLDTAFYYQGLLGRTPDAQGYKFWTSSNADPVTIASQFLTSSEYRQGLGQLNNLQFVDQLYVNMLGRSADTGGENYWANLLQQGVSRGALTTSFGTSTEYGTTGMPQLFSSINSLGNIWNI